MQFQQLRYGDRLFVSHKNVFSQSESVKLNHLKSSREESVSTAAEALANRLQSNFNNLTPVIPKDNTLSFRGPVGSTG